MHTHSSNRRFGRGDVLPAVPTDLPGTMTTVHARLSLPAKVETPLHTPPYTVLHLPFPFSFSLHHRGRATAIVLGTRALSAPGPRARPLNGSTGFRPRIATQKKLQVSTSVSRTWLEARLRGIDNKDLISRRSRTRRQHLFPRCCKCSSTSVSLMPCIAVLWTERS